MSALYDPIAHEYYSDFHKTCRNFDLATKNAIEKNKITLPNDGLVLEVGAGRGRVHEFFGAPPQRTVQLDSSSEMLALSKREDCLIRIVQSAENLPFLNNQFNCIVALLCDPYWGLEFLAECYRVLTPGGVFIATLPDHEWGTALRTSLGYNTKYAKFKLEKGGADVLIPSNLASIEQIESMMTVSGFKEKIKISRAFLPEDISIEMLSEDIKVAAKHKNVDPHHIPIITVISTIKA